MFYMLIYFLGKTIHVARYETIQKITGDGGGFRFAFVKSGHPPLRIGKIWLPLCYKFVYVFYALFKPLAFFK